MVKEVSEKTKDSSTWDMNPLSSFSDTWESIQSWFQELPHNIAEWSVDLMGVLYELSASLILKTPLWIFDNDWFHNTTYKFSLLSIGIVSVLTILESIKQMLSGVRGKRKTKPMEFKKIMERWLIVALASAGIPFLFKKAFEILNIVSDRLIAMGSHTMKDVAIPEAIKLFDVLTLVTFDIVLISTIIPVLWKNGRRFFDIMVLGVSTPFALTAWIFDSYRHLFNQWWDNLKHLSLVQVYYSLFLLILGWFIFGVPTPDTYTGMIVKLLIVIGGFARMVNPPRIISKHLDSGGDLGDITEDGIKNTAKKVKENYQDTRDILSGVSGWTRFAWRKINSSSSVPLPKRKKKKK
ncbi:hypothetical protein BH753_gp023 [Bacillus phage Shbh1]|uniref:Transmembrane protein n=1 Tax=Bacillus phage Shbh1 TaxID=1796992 RepID=A0A142F148_9CAUD|nr:hypothetical protein BH753_gp023 [Bacillus phage Shbh1]AMQ66505.1 hypothetical protein [Bacillus phage Shbh1]